MAALAILAIRERDRGASVQLDMAPCENGCGLSLCLTKFTVPMHIHLEVNPIVFSGA